jgi:outer membrane protein OmpA-like peptidoglycan-associated protein
MRYRLDLIKRTIVPALVFLFLLTSSCAPPPPVPVAPPPEPSTQFVLLPDPDGKVGVLEVSNIKGAQTLDKAWQATESAGSKAPGEAKLMDEKQVRQTFREALDAEPIQPVGFIMYFRPDSAKPSAESLELLPRVIDAIRTRKSTNIVVSGHTDAVSTVDYNHRLSLRRATAVADMLVAKGIDRQNIQITYHGKGNPLVPTPDGVPEPRNRRVEITVR